MTPEIEKKRREAFEAWADDDHLSRAGNEYENPYVESAWNGFNAALDAVEIELPSNRDVNHDKAAISAIDSCRQSIKATGLGLKVK